MPSPPAPPVQISRKGWRKYFPPTATDFEAAILSTSMILRTKRWYSVDDLLYFIADDVGRQLNHNIMAEVVGDDLESLLPFIRVTMNAGGQTIFRHVQVKDTQFAAPARQPAAAYTDHTRQPKPERPQAPAHTSTNPFANRKK